MPDRDDKIKNLMLKYPDLFRNGTCSCGFYVDEGWLTIMETLCFLVDGHLKLDTVVQRTAKVMTGQKRKCRMRKEIYIDQVKEKFGTLRVYFNKSDEYIDGVVAAMEAMSAVTCEICSGPGSRRQGGCIKTLCDKCHKKKIGPRQT